MNSQIGRSKIQWDSREIQLVAKEYQRISTSSSADRWQPVPWRIEHAAQAVLPEHRWRRIKGPSYIPVGMRQLLANDIELSRYCGHTYEVAVPAGLKAAAPNVLMDTSSLLNEAIQKMVDMRFEHPTRDFVEIYNQVQDLVPDLSLTRITHPQYASKDVVSAFTQACMARSAAPTPVTKELEKPKTFAELAHDALVDEVARRIQPQPTGTIDVQAISNAVFDQLMPRVQTTLDGYRNKLLKDMEEMLLLAKDTTGSTVPVATAASPTFLDHPQDIPEPNIRRKVKLTIVDDPNSVLLQLIEKHVDASKFRLKITHLSYKDTAAQTWHACSDRYALISHAANVVVRNGAKEALGSNHVVIFQNNREAVQGLEAILAGLQPA